MDEKSQQELGCGGHLRVRELGLTGLALFWVVAAVQYSRRAHDQRPALAATMRPI